MGVDEPAPHTPLMHRATQAITISANRMAADLRDELKVETTPKEIENRPTDNSCGATLCHIMSR
jgi:hypothetical protein